MGLAHNAEAQTNLDGHAFYVDEFYFIRKDYQAASNRFMGLLQYYPDSGYHQRALNYIAEYKRLVAEGEIEEIGNQRESTFDSPFLQQTNDPYANTL